MLKTTVESTAVLAKAITALSIVGPAAATAGNLVAFTEHVDSGPTAGRSRHFSPTNQSHPALVRLSNLKEGWDGCGAPSPSYKALYWADRLLARGDQNGLTPTHVMACVDGGITIHYHGKHSATIEIFNSGEMVFAKSAGPGTTTVQEFIQSGESIDQVVEEAGGFVS